MARNNAVFSGETTDGPFVGVQYDVIEGIALGNNDGSLVGYLMGCLMV